MPDTLGPTPADERERTTGSPRRGPRINRHLGKKGAQVARQRKPGGVYLLHFDSPLAHAQHYLGWGLSIERRVAHHFAGRGSHITRAFYRAGIPGRLVRVWVGGDRALERRLKNGRRGTRLCPICNPGALNLNAPGVR